MKREMTVGWLRLGWPIVRKGSGWNWVRLSLSSFSPFSSFSFFSSISSCSSFSSCSPISSFSPITSFSPCLSFRPFHFFHPFHPALCRLQTFCFIEMWGTIVLMISSVFSWYWSIWWSWNLKFEIAYLGKLFELQGSSSWAIQFNFP